MEGYLLLMDILFCGIGEKFVSCVFCFGGFVVCVNNLDDLIFEKWCFGKIYYVWNSWGRYFLCYNWCYFLLLKGFIDFFYEDLEFSYVE